MAVIATGLWASHVMSHAVKERKYGNELATNQNQNTEAATAVILEAQRNQGNVTEILVQVME